MEIEATPDNIAHLLRRAAWVGTPEEIEDGVDRGVEATVEGLFDATAAPTVSPPHPTPGVEGYPADALHVWFVHLAATSPTPAIERLCWFWHGHFATSLDKIEQPDLLGAQLLTLRRLGLGRFDDLVVAVTNDTAMNMWLDLHTSVRGAPNENYARELLELFTLGRGEGYGQADVAAAARALTGHDIVHDPQTWRVLGTRLNPAFHDHGPITFLGHTGRFAAEDLIALIVERPECHRFVASRLWHRYAGTPIPDDVADDLTKRFADDLRIDRLLVAMLTHPAFYSDEVRHGLVAQPVESIVRAIRGFALPVPDPSTEPWWSLVENEATAEAADAPAAWGWEMGQMVGRPPNVGGWPHNEAWLDSNHAVGRLSVAEGLGWRVADSDGELAERLRATAGRPADLASHVLEGFGLTSWSTSTLRAVEAGARAPDPHLAVATAVAAAFTSPEVTLS